MQIHQLKPTKQKSRRRVGRGGKRGSYSGRGGKGQTARTGARLRPAIRDFIRKIPKLRGVPAGRYKKQGVKQYAIPAKIVNLRTLETRFSDGEVVSPKTLLEKRLVRRIKGKTPRIKILAGLPGGQTGGTLAKKLVFEGVGMSEKVKKLS